jgi:type 1 glutamine amidotransferase
VLVASSAAAPPAGWRLLVFTKTAGFRHDSIPAAIAAVEALGAANGFAVDATEDAGAFTDSNLSNYRGVMFLLTTGDVLDDTQQAAFQRYIEAGGGFVGVHSASDTEHDWPWYGSLVGAYFAAHPAIQTATIDVADPRGPGTVGLPSQWQRTDEWYGFSSNPRPFVHVLATLDESTYDPGDSSMGADHPIAWWHDYDGGRSWYTALGHTDSSYSEPLFLTHLLGGIEYAAGRVAPAAPPPAPPTVLAVRTSVDRGRVTIAVRVHGCRSCSSASHHHYRRPHANDDAPRGGGHGPRQHLASPGRPLAAPGDGHRPVDRAEREGTPIDRRPAVPGQPMTTR